MSKKVSKQELFQNVVIGLTVSFVALSLGAAFGILSGRGAFAGMFSAGLISVVTSLFGGTRIQCSGPTAPMSAIAAVVVAAAFELPEGNPDHFINLVLLLTALLMVVMGLLKLGRFISLIPNVVISGFMNGIALLIWFDQIKKVFGLGGKTAFDGPLSANVSVAAITCALLFLLPPLMKRFLPFPAAFHPPATLVVMVLMTVIVRAVQIPIEGITMGGTLDGAGDLVDLVKSQIPQSVTWGLVATAAPFALQLALLGYLDSLLTSLVVDKMTGEKTKQNQELIAQGAANGLVAFVGGIPGAQATIRSVLMVKENATLRLAGILVGVFVIVEMLLLQSWISLIPSAVFTGILLKVGWEVFDHLPIQLYLKQKTNAAHERGTPGTVYVANREMLFILGTALVTLFINLNVAVIGFSVLFFILNRWVFTKKPLRDLKPFEESESFIDEG